MSFTPHPFVAGRVELVSRRGIGLSIACRLPAGKMRLWELIWSVHRDVAAKVFHGLVLVKSWRCEEVCTVGARAAAFSARAAVDVIGAFGSRGRDVGMIAGWNHGVS